MNNASGIQDGPAAPGSGRTVSILLWLALSTCWLVAVFSVVEEMCLATACRDTAAFTVFGFNMGWFGIGNFSLILLLLRLRRKSIRVDLLLSALVFAGVGAEFRLLWIQKYIIGAWCPLCVTICCALFIAAGVLVCEKVRSESGKRLAGWAGLVTVMSAVGLAVAMVGVKALM